MHAQLRIVIPHEYAAVLAQVIRRWRRTERVCGALSGMLANLDACHRAAVLGRAYDAHHQCYRSALTSDIMTAAKLHDRPNWSGRRHDLHQCTGP